MHTSDGAGASAAELDIAVRTPESRLTRFGTALHTDSDSLICSIGAHHGPSYAGAPSAVRQRTADQEGYEAGFPRLMVHAEDVTARRQVEQALRESEAAYRTLAEHLPGIA